MAPLKEVDLVVASRRVTAADRCAIRDALATQRAGADVARLAASAKRRLQRLVRRNRGNPTATPAIRP